MEQSRVVLSDPGAAPWLRGLAALQSVTEAALSTVKLEELLPTVAMRVGTAFSADAVVVLLRVPTDEDMVEVSAAFGIEARGARLPLAGTLAGHVIDEGRGVAVNDHAHSPVRCPVLARFGARSVLAAPLPSANAALGAILVGMRAPYPFGETEVDWLTAMGERIAAGIDRAIAFDRALEARQRAEAAERRYRALVDNLHHAIVWEMDPHSGRFRLIGGRAVALLGHPRQRWIEDPRFFFRCVPEEDRRSVEELLTNAAAGDAEQQCEHRLVAADGRALWFHSAVRLEHDDGEQLRGLSVEISALKSAEEELRHQLELTRAIAGSLGDGVYALDRAGRAIFLNAAMERMLGWSAAELRGAELHRVARFRVAEEPDAAPACPLEEVLEARAPIRDEAIMSRRDGSTVHVAYSASPVFNGIDVIGAVMAVRDIGARKRAEAAQRFLADASQVLQESIDYQTTLGRVAQLAVPVLADWCMVDMLADDGTLQHLASAHVNPAKNAIVDRLLRYDSDARSHPVKVALARHRAILQPRVRDRHLASLAQDPEHLELLRRLELRSILLVPLEARGRTLGAITLARTESDRRYDRHDLVLAEELGRRAALAIDNARLYEEAQRAVRLREEVLAVVSHDLRNPLSSIAVNAMVIADLAPHDATGLRVRRLAAACRRAMSRMRRMIDDLLDFASIEAGRLSLAAAPHGVVEIVSEALEMMQPLAIERRVRLEAPPLPGPFSVLCDRERILQVLSNLIGNAIKFTRTGGAVRLQIEGAAAEARISISDEGPGIAADQLPRIFDRYWRAERRGRGAAGLGLAIVKSLVEAHGGRVWAESQPGQGSTFHFTLPRAA